MVYPSDYVKKKREDFLPRGMTGKKHLEKSKKQMGTTKKERYNQGIIKAWNKGMTPRKGEYLKIFDEIVASHMVWCKANQIHRVPDGCEIHHLDFNPRNNNQENLQLIDIISHRKFHNEISKKIREGEIII
jgi:hypothetical protein